MARIKAPLTMEKITVAGIMEKFNNQQDLTMFDEEFLYTHGTVDQIIGVFSNYPHGRSAPSIIETLH